MKTTLKNPITVSVIVNAPLETVWTAWTTPKHITGWAFASSDWAAPHAENNVAVGGRFLTRMEAKDGSVGFDFSGTYDIVEQNARIEYTMDGDDKRRVMITFEPVEGGVKVTESFDMEDENSAEQQREGWQAILENFKTYAEAL